MITDYAKIVLSELMLPLMVQRAVSHVPAVKSLILPHPHVRIVQPESSLLVDRVLLVLLTQSLESERAHALYVQRERNQTPLKVNVFYAQ